MRLQMPAGMLQASVQQVFRSCSHRATRRPMRPKPLMPILIFSLPLLDGSVMAGGLSATTARVCMIALRATGFAPLRSMRSGEATRADCCRSACGLTCPEKSFADGANLLLPAMQRAIGVTDPPQTIDALSPATLGMRSTQTRNPHSRRKRPRATHHGLSNS